MANHEINEEQEAVNKALRMIETSDPVHADVYNALFSILINNDVFLEKLANKMVQQVMISHVMDSTNPDMVMGADQGPVITKLIEKVQKQVDVLNTNTKWTSFETVKDPEFTVEFAKCGAIAFVSVIRDNNGSENVDKQIEYPDKYKPFHKISVSNYSSDKEAFIELDTKLRIYAVQGHWVQINTVYPVQI